jgi:hypothetical protein
VASSNRRVASHDIGEVGRGKHLSVMQKPDRPGERIAHGHAAAVGRPIHRVRAVSASPGTTLIALRSAATLCDERLADVVAGRHRNASLSAGAARPCR